MAQNQAQQQSFKPSEMASKFSSKADLVKHANLYAREVLGRSAESWMAMQANHTLARYQVELEQWTPTKQVTAEGLVTVFVRG